MILETLAAVLLIASLAAVPRILMGPTPADRILATQLAGTGTVATILVLGAAGAQGALYDVALTFAVLAAIAGIAFVSLRGPAE